MMTFLDDIPKITEVKSCENPISWFKHVQKILDDDINDDHGTVLQGFSRTFAPCCALYALIRALQPLVLHHHRLARCARGSPVKL